MGGEDNKKKLPAPQKDLSRAFLQMTTSQRDSTGSRCASECFFSVKPKLLKPQKYFYLIFALHPDGSTNFVGENPATGQQLKYCECSVMQQVLKLKVHCKQATKILFTHAGDTRAHFILIPDDESVVAVQKQYTAATVVTFKTILNYRPSIRKLESPLHMFTDPQPEPLPYSKTRLDRTTRKMVNLLSASQLPSCNLQELLYRLENQNKEPWVLYTTAKSGARYTAVPTLRIRNAPVVF